MADDIMAGLTDIVRDVFMDDTITLTPGMWADDIVGWSSIMLVEIVLSVQDRFGVRIPADEADKLTSMGDLAALIAKHKAQGR